MKIPVLVYPDKRLKIQSESVDLFDTSLHTLLDNMYDTMIESNGIGLAAIQIGAAQRILLLCMPNEEGEQLEEDLLEVINPVVSDEEGTTVYQEGCLSVPSFYEDVERFEKITLTYQNRYGETHTLKAEGLLSVAIQHEIDHLNGKLFIERLSYIRRKKFEKEFKKALKAKKKEAS